MKITPQMNPFSQASTRTFQAGLAFPDAGSTKAGFDAGPAKGSFKDVMVNMVKDTDKTLTEPDALMNRAMTTGDVDIHEVMIANTKADIAINIVSQVATKVIQAYERVQQIQV